jgi:nitrite reductase/ring-hydroxylating ferredoxin subunit
MRLPRFARNDGLIHNMQNLTLICSLQRLDDPGSYGFSVEVNGEQVDGFVVRRDNEYFAYRNSCPHTGSPLDWVEHQFLDVEGALIQCAVHDARFLIESGECVFGPCPGASLESLPNRVQDDNIYLLGVA